MAHRTLFAFAALRLLVLVMGCMGAAAFLTGGPPTTPISKAASDAGGHSRTTVDEISTGPRWEERSGGSCSWLTLRVLDLLLFVVPFREVRVLYVRSCRSLQVLLLSATRLDSQVESRTLTYGRP